MDEYNTDFRCNNDDDDDDDTITKLDNGVDFTIQADVGVVIYDTIDNSTSNRLNKIVEYDIYFIWK